MENRNTVFSNLIIGGTIKAATSSVFTYLSAHPEVCGSSVKETFFFTNEYTGNEERDQERYGKHFSPKYGANISFEASPNYLGYKENVAPRIKKLLPGAKLLFILRNPVERLYSYYNFSLGKLQIRESLRFEDYINLCEQYTTKNLLPEKAGIAEKHLRALKIGKYSRYLQNYYDVFPAECIKVMFFDDLKKDHEKFMMEVCRFIDVDPNFYRGYTFGRVNATFSSRIKPLHHVAMLLNRMFESVLRQRPSLKMRLVQIYKRLNQDREGYVAMADSTRTKLEKYYSQSNKELEELFPGQALPKWVK